MFFLLKKYIFKNVNLTLDTDWKLGLIGRNGSGKTTLLKLLLGEYESNNAISKNIEFEYFPYFNLTYCFFFKFRI